MNLWQISGRLAGEAVEVAWDDALGFRAPAEVMALIDVLAGAGTQVVAPPSGPAWPIGWDGPDQAYFSTLAVLDAVEETVGDPPGWPWGVPEGATDR